MLILHKLFLSYLVFLFACITNAFGQQDDVPGEKDSIIIIQENERWMEGIHAGVAKNAVLLQRWNGTLDTIPIGSIKHIFPWTDDPQERRRIERKTSLRHTWMYPNYHRYVGSGNYLPLKAGQGYVSNTMLTALGFRMGLTDEFSIGVGVEPISFLFSNGPRDFGMASISPRFSININENWYVGATLSYVVNMGQWFDNAGDYFVGLVGATYGNHVGNFTFNTGWINKDGSNIRLPAFTLSGMIKADHRRSFVTDNILLPTGNNRYSPILSFGFRNDVGKRVGNKRVSFGMVAVYAPIFVQGDIPVIPVFDISFELR